MIKILVGSILILILFIVLFMLVYVVCNPISHGPPNYYDLDHQTCMQMREEGCGEEEIENFMMLHDGYYFEEDE